MKDWLEIFREKLRHWWVSAYHNLPEILLAIIVLVVAFYTSKLARRGFYSLSLKLSGRISFSSLFSRIIQIIVLSTGLFIALDILQLDKALSSLLAGAGILGIILGFAFQDITANFISGIYIAFKKPFELGNTIKTNDFIGHVEEIQLRSTTIRTFSGLHLMIPNKEIIQKPLINYSLTNERRIELEFFVEHTVDLRLTHELVLGAISQITYLYPGKNVEIYFNDFRFTTVKISVWFWIDNHLPPGYMVARHDAIFNIIAALKDENISLAAPISLENLAVATK